MATRATDPTGAEAPRGRDAVVDAVLDAAERLFARSGPAAVSLRDIANEAEVTYSLINRHFGTKDALVDRLLQRYATRWTAALGDDPDYASALEQLLGTTPDAGAYLRLLAWSLLNDDETAIAHRRHSLLDQLPTLRSGEGDQQVDTALALSLVFGWRFFSPFISAALHLDDDTVDRVHDAVRSTALEP